MKHELRKIKSEYATPRKTVIQDEMEEIKIDILDSIPKEDVIVTITNDGYVKRVSKRSYNKDEETMLKEGDYVIGKYALSTLDTLLVFTDNGNYLYIPVYELPEAKWKELGKHVSNLVKMDADEQIIGCLGIKNFNENKCITIYTKNGMIKRTNLNEFKVQRYSKPINCMKLKEYDKVVGISFDEKDNILLTTKRGFALKYQTSEVTPIGLKTAGVKAISLKDDELVSGHIVNDDDILLMVTDKTSKRIHVSDIELSTRARKGMRIIRDVKTNPYYVLKTFVVNHHSQLIFKNKDDELVLKMAEIPFADLQSVGTSISKNKVLYAYIACSLEEKNNDSEENIKEEKSIGEDELRQIDNQIMTIDDFLDNIEIDK